MAEHVESRTSAQTRSHAQKYIRKLNRYGCEEGEEEELAILNSKAAKFANAKSIKVKAKRPRKRHTERTDINLSARPSDHSPSGSEGRQGRCVKPSKCAKSPHEVKKGRRSKGGNRKGGPQPVRMMTA